MEEKVKNYILATSAYGGDGYESLSLHYTPEGQEAFENWLEGEPKVSGVTLYRGYNFERRYWEDGMVEEGSVIGVDQMTQGVDLPAFTLGPLRAVNYMNDFGDGVVLGDGQKVLFEVETTGRAFVDISRYSFYPKEDEHRCTRQAQLFVVSVKQKGGYLEVKCREV